MFGAVCLNIMYMGKGERNKEKIGENYIIHKCIGKKGYVYRFYTYVYKYTYIRVCEYFRKSKT